MKMLSAALVSFVALTIVVPAASYYGKMSRVVFKTRGRDTI